MKGTNLNIAELLNRLKLLAIELHFKKKKKVLPPGTSRFGGFPYLPTAFEWPYFTGSTLESKKEVKRPLTFLLQINCAELSVYNTEHLLPSTGMLYFFYEYASMKWGYDPKDKGCARVFYYDGYDKDMVITQPPSDFYKYIMDCDEEFPELAITFKNIETIPDYEEFNQYHHACVLNEYETESKRCLKNNKESQPCDNSHLLGYANIIQDSMLDECEYVTQGYFLGNSIPRLPKAKREEIYEQSKEWTLLLQLGTISDGEDFELMWGDGGCLYFYIKKEDLLAKRFDNIWVVLQCG